MQDVEIYGILLNDDFLLSNVNTIFFRVSLRNIYFTCFFFPWISIVRSKITLTSLSTIEEIIIF